MKRLLALCSYSFVLLGLSSAVVAQQVDYLDELPPLIDRELFFGDPEISGAQLAPDGQFISFIKPYEEVRNIWVKGINEPFEAARPVTADDRPVPGYFWSEDGDYLLYVQDKGGNENFHVYAVDPTAPAVSETGVPPARDITPLENVRAVIYSVPEDTPNEIIVGLNDRDPAYHDVYRVNLETGERELLIENTEQVGAYIYDDQGDVRFAYRQTPGGGTEMLTVEPDGTLGETLYECDYTESCVPVEFHADNKRIYLRTNKGNRNLSELVLFDPATKAETLVDRDPEGEVDFGGAIFSDQTGELLATFYTGDRQRIYPKDEQFERDLEVLRSELPEGELGINSMTEDENLFLISVQRDVDPGSVYVYNRETGEVELLYRSRPDLPSEQLAEMQPIRYRARDGREIPAYLTIPKGVEAENLAVVIHPHGGPWSRDTWGYNPFVQFLANRGYAVLQPNFRSSTGYGKEFLNAGNREWGTGAMQHDVTDGVQYLIDQGIADPERVGIFGGSYGGYATLAGVVFTPELYAAAVPYVAPSNLITLIESFPAYWRPFMEGTWYRRVGDPAEAEDRVDLMARSPLFGVEQIRTPLLVVHGANDPRVTQLESDQLVVALRDRGINVEYLVAPDEGHGFRSPLNRLALAASMERFLAAHLGGRYQEEMSTEVANTLEAITVDPTGVVLPDQSRAASAETTPLPMTDGRLIRPAELEYTARMKINEQEITIDVARSIAAASFESEPVWRIVDMARTPMGSSTDTTEVAKSTLKPMRRTVGGPGSSMQLRYTDETIHGEMGQMGQVSPIDMKLDAPVLGDGAGLEIALAGLPLKAGYETTFRIFDTMKRKVRPMSLQVTEQKSTEVPAGTYETYQVELVPLDGDTDGTATLEVLQDAPHYMVRAETRLPAAMGGGLLTTELTDLEFGGTD